MRSPADDTTLYEILQHHERGILPPVVTKTLLGEAFTPIDALLSGVCPAGGEWSTDWRRWTEHLEAQGLPRASVVALECATIAPSIDLIAQVRSMIRTREARERCDYWAALLGDRISMDRLYARYHDALDIRSAFVLGLRVRCQKPKDKLGWWRGVEAQVLMHGVELLQMRHVATYRTLDALTAFEAKTSGGTGIDPRSQFEAYVVDAVLKAEPLRRQTKRVAGVQPAEPVVKADIPDTQLKPGERVSADDPRRYDRDMSGQLHDLHLGIIVDERTPDEIRAAKSERAAKWKEANLLTSRTDDDPVMRDLVDVESHVIGTPSREFPMVMVLDNFRDVIEQVADQRGDNELVKHLSALSGRYVDLATGPSHIHEIAIGLREAWPHAQSVIERILADIRPGEPIRLRPTLLVGSPGSGKTSLAREIGSALNLATTVFPCASVADGSFGGTPAQWSTRRASTPLEAIRRSRTANPLVLLDEIEKTGVSGTNGSLMNALLPMLERHSAAEYFEVGIERNANLSWVGFIATANDLSTVPAPLRDRFRVIQMPNPGTQHLGDLARRIVRDIAIENGTNPAWTAPLAQDEMRVITKAWGGGSLRRLRLAVQATLDAREMMLRGRMM